MLVQMFSVNLKVIMTFWQFGKKVTHQSSTTKKRQQITLMSACTHTVQNNGTPFHVFYC